MELLQQTATNVMKVFSFIWAVTKPFRLYIFITVAAIIFYATILVGIPYIIKHLINAAQEPDFALLHFYGVMFIALELMATISWRCADWALMKYEPALRNHITQVLFKRLSLHSHQFYQHNFTGALLAKSGDLAISIPKMIQTIVNSILLCVFTTTIAIVSMYSINPYMALALASWVTLFILISTAALTQFDFLATRAAHLGSQVLAVLADAVGNMLSIRLFASHEKEAKTIAFAQHQYLQASQARRWFTLKLNTAQGLSFWLYQSICLYLLIFFRAKSHITPGDFAYILTVNLVLVDNLWRLGESMREFADQWGLVEEALKTYYTPLEMQDVPNAQPLVATHGAIRFEQVQFNYAGSEPLFQNKTITIPAGQKVGLVGYSGSGKTTFVNLILRLYDLTSGRVLIDGQDIAQVTQSSLRTAVSFVPQEPSLFHRTIKENIAYGSTRATENEIKAAAHKAAAHDFIMQLPNGYETLVGERGTKLSGGQRQRIALARALLKDAPILILDEATSQLDTITERTIQSALEDYFQSLDATHKQTMIVIAHRLSTLLHMDRILVFNHGVIVQDGTHAQLLTQEGLYKTLWEAQTNSTQEVDI